MLALHPELVRMDRAVDEPDRSAGCFFAYRVSDESVHGTVGTPSLADASAGQTLLDLCVSELAQQLAQALTEATPLERAGVIPPPF
jgi:creatinine amidohydrolase